MVHVCVPNVGVFVQGIEANKNKSWGQLSAEMGVKDLFLKGLSTRVIMIGTLTGLQWYIYGQYKSLVGLGTS
jgi:solute carrier family 25 phosphate transporter 3